MYTGLSAWEDRAAIQTKSFIWLNPCGLDVLVPMKPVWLIRGMVKMYQNQFGAQFLDNVGKFIVTVIGNAFATSAPQDSIWGATTNHYTTRSNVSVDNLLIYYVGL